MLRFITNFIRTTEDAYWMFRCRVLFMVRRVRWPKNFRVRGPLGLSAGGMISIGDNVTIVNDSEFNRAGINHPTQLVAAPSASLIIGNNTGISGASIYSEERIEIGEYVLIGANCHIYDTDFHPLDWKERRASGRPATAPVVIEDDVWLAANVTVLKGVTIGARTVIAAGSVVTRDIPPGVLAAGSPAKVIKKLESAKE